jgi:hypothetical protein
MLSERMNEPQLSILYSVLFFFFFIIYHHQLARLGRELSERACLEDTE